MATRPAFLDQPAPKGYVAGMGRGATGFAVEAGDKSDPGSARGVVAEEGIFADAVDHEDSTVFAAIEERVARRRRKRVAAVASAVPAPRFDELKAGLQTVLADEWALLTAPGDLTRRNKRQRELEQQLRRTYAVPDSVLSGVVQADSTDRSIAAGELETIAQARSQLLSSRLDTLVHARPTPVVLEADYTDTLALETAHERAVLRLLRRAQPDQPLSWIASARLEESVRDLDAARRLIHEGCQQLRFVPEMWLEAVRLNEGHRREQRVLAAEALRFNPTSEELWEQAVVLETGSTAVQVVRRGIEHIPASERLWLRCVALEPEDDNKRKLLAKAVELVPGAIELWRQAVELAPLVAQKREYLQQARKHNPHSPDVWLMAMRVEEETTGNEVKLERMAEGLVRQEKDSFEVWMRRAEELGAGGYPLSAAVVARAACAVAAWDTVVAVSPTSPAVASAVNAFLTHTRPLDTLLWLRALAHERSIRSDLLFTVYQDAVRASPSTSRLWLMYAKDRWVLGDDAEGAAAVLADAVVVLPDNEDVWKARVKLAIHTQRWEEAHALLQAAREHIPASPRFWYKQVHVYRHQGNLDQALATAAAGVERFPAAFQLRLQQAEMYTQLGRTQDAREALLHAGTACPCDAVWLALAQMEVRAGDFSKARSVLDTALARSALARLWTARVRVEAASGNLGTARTLAATAVARFPQAPSVWLEHGRLTAKRLQRHRVWVDALGKTNNDSDVMVAVGVHFWTDGKHDKAGVWFARAVEAEPRNGDAWGWQWRWAEQHASAAAVEAAVEAASRVTRGEAWLAASKDPALLGASRTLLVRAAAAGLDTQWRLHDDAGRALP